MLYMIARITDEKGHDTLGYRIFDTESNKAANISESALLSRMKHGVKIGNLTIDNDKLKGVGGSIARYTVVSVSGMILGSSRIVIIGEGKLNGETVYSVVNVRGDLVQVSEKEIMRYRNVEIANGKLVVKNGKGYISAISGNYEEVEDKSKIIKTVYQVSKFKEESNDGYIQVDGVYVKKDKGGTFLCKEGTDSNTSTKLNAMYVYESEGEKHIVAIQVTEEANKKRFEITNSNFHWYKYRLLVNDILFVGGLKRYPKNTRSRERVEELNEDKFIVGIGEIGVVIYRIDNNRRTQNKLYCKLYTEIKSKQDLVDFISSCQVKIKPENLEFIYARVEDLKERNIISYTRISVEEMDKRLRLKTLKQTNDTGIDGMIYKATIDNIIASEWHMNRQSVKMYKQIRQELLAAHCKLACCISMQTNEELFYSTIDDEMAFGTQMNIKDSILYAFKLKPFRYILYFLLEENNIFKKDNSIEWLTLEEQTTFKKSLLGWWALENSVVIYTYITRIEYDKDKLRQVYKEDVEKISEEAKKISKVEAKGKLFGMNIKINDFGMLEEWEDGAEVIQSSSIKGIIKPPNEKMRGNKLTIKVRDRLEIHTNIYIIKLHIYI